MHAKCQPRIPPDFARLASKTPVVPRIITVATSLGERIRTVTGFIEAFARYGIHAAQTARMTGNSKNSKSYEDIVRQTVVEPDSSARPTKAQELAAREGFRALDGDEAGLQQRVVQALSTVGGLSAVHVEVARNLVTLRGSVAAPGMLRTLEDIVAAVPGVDTIHEQVVITTASR